jgi:ribosomal protein S18 acetylase RimI-like enzyme
MTAPSARGSDSPSVGSGELLIRRATDEDAACLAAFAERTFVETFGADNSAENLAAHVAKSFGPAIQLREIRDPDMITLVAALRATLAGFAQVRRGTPPSCVIGKSPVELLRFYVDRPFHGRGIAQALMRTVDDVARAIGGRTLWLGVWERNPRAIAFYTKCGFVDVGEQTFLVGADEQTDRVMARSLRS